MTEYNAEYFLHKLETSLENIDQNVTTLQNDVKEIQINMAEFKHLGTLLERMASVESKVIETNLDLAKVKEQVHTLKENVDKNQLNFGDVFNSIGSVIGWMVGIITVLYLVIK